MENTADFPIWLVPVIVLGFPLVFAGFWSAICALLARVSGYRSLNRFAIDAAEAKQGELIAKPVFARIGFVSYRGGILSLRSSRNGLILHVMPLFPFHQPVLVPWQLVHEGESGGTGRFALGTFMLDNRVRLRVPSGAFTALQAAKGDA